MSDEFDDGGLAFPTAAKATGENDVYQPGMTLLDWFAGQALVRGVRGVEDGNQQVLRASVAEKCYLYAEAMVAEKRKREKA